MKDFYHKRAEFAIHHYQTSCSISLQTEQTLSVSRLFSHKIIFVIFSISSGEKTLTCTSVTSGYKRQRERTEKREKHSQSYLSGANKDKLQQQERPSKSGGLNHVVPEGRRGGSLKSFSLGFAGSEEPRRKQPHGLRFSYLVCPRSLSHQGLMYIHTMLSHGEVVKWEDTVGRGHGAHGTNRQSQRVI